MWQLGTELDDVPELAVDHALYVEGNGSRRYAPSWCMLLLMMVVQWSIDLANVFDAYPVYCVQKNREQLTNLRRAQTNSASYPPEGGN